MADVELLIYNGTTIQSPIVLDGIKFEQSRDGSPSKLEFTVIKDDLLNFTEGNKVTFRYGDRNVFSGFVFTKKRNKDGQIKVTAYDQLYYLKKNSWSYAYENKTASQALVELCRIFGLNVGTIENTKFIVPPNSLDEKTLIDIVKKGLDETLTNTGNIYVLYDDFGSITLKNMANMITNVLIDKDTAADFDYSSTIDGEVWNRVVLFTEDSETKERKSFVAESEKGNANISNWGLMQYYKKADDQQTAQLKANSLLRMYNQKIRTLDIKGAFGNLDAKAGSLVVVHLDLGDTVRKSYMIVKTVKHTFNNNEWTMDLTLEGAWED